MNPIISSQVQPPLEFHHKKVLLNEEFNKKAKIQGLVSYIYYPSQKDFPLIGHTELEIEGSSYTLMMGLDIKPLNGMIKSSESGNGFPFFRVHISVTPEQLRDLRENAPETNGVICSIGVARVLYNYGQYTIPLPIALFPSTSAIYLSMANLLGSRRVHRIDFHGGNVINNILKGIPGFAFELWAIYSKSLRILGA